MRRKSNRRLVFAALCLLAVTAVLVWTLRVGSLQAYFSLLSPPAQRHAVVVYGGSFAACAAAYQAAAHLPPGQTVLMVVPESALGGVGTVGGQNFFDIRNWRGEPPTRGSFARWFAAFGQGYPTGEMSEFLYAEVVGGFPNKVRVLFNHEIEAVHLAKDSRGVQSRGTGGGPEKLEAVIVRPVARNPETQAVEWTGRARTFHGEVFIDASDNGRLARLAGVPLSPGRADWAGDAHQQAVTLMFQVTGVEPQAAIAYRHPETGKPEFFYFQEADGSRLGWGGKDFTGYDPVVAAYNAGGHRFTLKGYNIAEDTPGRWWLNILLIHEVNGMMQELDRGTERWPAAGAAAPAELVAEDQWSADRAHREALAELERPRFLEALRRFPGFEGVALVRGADGRPVVGEVLYVRETAHAVRENGTFALFADAVRGAGDGPGTGADRDLHSTRVGLGFYYVDINAYRKGEPVQTLETPANPHYIPFATLTTPAVENLLLPGYAQSTSSEAWASMRVIPNLTVCGDAAGAAAAYCAANNKSPAALGPEDIREIQNQLKAAGARLDK
ncbi:FAD-dependent oxidoreductase [Candidatus Desulforudis audaxviator]|uniref:FAD-dependent oxidoreductase n=1 Tax=Candidatus Desulforudis audaxviator TaxID=471827 RepID=UPI0005A120B1|nr:FAD-dependent oxidoreductase [Candidatus Desulforudis audaxviator]AZK60668.1 Putative membrane protein [Candidatus Desulforudis audaxviator]